MTFLEKSGTGLQKIDSEELAGYIIAKWGDMNHLKLQKLLYYVEAWHLAYFECSIIDDDFEAWAHGPVIRKIWDRVKDKSVLYNLITVTNKDEVIKEVESKLKDEQIEVINDILKEYGSKTSYALECLTHDEEPWIEAREGLPLNAPCTNKISKDTMRNYYSKLLEK